MIFEDTQFRTVYPEFPKLLQINALWANCGALRGVHAALRSENHWKVVTCVYGSVRDAVVDLRPGSPSFGEMRAIDIKDAAPMTLVIPPGFGHAVQGLTKKSLVVYGTNVEYVNNKEFEINPLSNDWERTWSQPIILSARDQSAPVMSDFLKLNILKEEI
jgi:hypothetical protein